MKIISENNFHAIVRHSFVCGKQSLPHGIVAWGFWVHTGRQAEVGQRNQAE
ncbi:MAG: hypothetical protein NC344_00235 [Bacteroidales bacterium]|nr:hypothetical protein [Bacteroidales bacterium]MCM1146265.1 hypothetical protein [Bacteroidales bacterium]MCM1205297.1 hypothetical protein [Bacillota bacterium]MCM1509616.1 hypothetical protein [Clostridium sp.]